MPDPEHAGIDTEAGRKTKYRQDIDGLRGISILLVLVFHLEASWCPQGYLGVDMFFVISGFLIAIRSLGKDSLHRSVKEQILDFYERRLRRIWPAFSAAILFTYTIAWFFLLGNTFEEYVHYQRCATAMVTNLCLYNGQLPYFAQQSEQNLLLHTWSLAVEEQFYLSFPLIFLFAVACGNERMKMLGSALAVCSGMSAAGYGYYVWTGGSSEDALFYLPCIRPWEIFAGSIIAILEIDQHKSKVHDVVCWLGLLFVISCPLTKLYTLAAVAFPSVVISSSPDAYLNRFLAKGFVVYVGRISYSLYLFHWPIMVIMHRALLVLPDGQVGCYVVGAVLTVISAVLSFQYVETPFRNRKAYNRNWIYAGCAVSFTLMMSMTYIPRHLQHSSIPYWQQSRWDTAERLLTQQSRLYVLGNNETAKGFTSGRPFLMGTGDRKHEIVVMGDSFAGSLGAGVNAALLSLNLSGIGVGKGGCVPVMYPGEVPTHVHGSECVDFIEKVFGIIRRERPKLVVIAGRYSHITDHVKGPNKAKIYMQKGAEELVRRLCDLQVGVIAITGIPELVQKRPCQEAADRVVLFGKLPKQYHEKLSKATLFDRRARAIFKRLEGQLECFKGIIDVGPDMCPDATCKSALVAERDTCYFLSDGVHLSTPGSFRLRNRFAAGIGRVIANISQVKRKMGHGMGLKKIVTRPS